jgi:hypothetical protein
MCRVYCTYEPVVKDQVRNLLHMLDPTISIFRSDLTAEYQGIHHGLRVPDAHSSGLGGLSSANEPKMGRTYSN